MIEKKKWILIQCILLPYNLNCILNVKTNWITAFSMFKNQSYKKPVKIIGFCIKVSSI